MLGIRVFYCLVYERSLARLSRLNTGLVQVNYVRIIWYQSFGSLIKYVSLLFFVVCIIIQKKLLFLISFILVSCLLSIHFLCDHSDQIHFSLLSWVNFILFFIFQFVSLVFKKNQIRFYFYYLYSKTLIWRKYISI